MKLWVFKATKSCNGNWQQMNTTKMKCLFFVGQSYLIGLKGFGDFSGFESNLLKVLLLL